MNKYAYIRVSTKEQNIDRQYMALQPYCIPKENIFCDVQSGKDFDRPQYKSLIRHMKRGDWLIVNSIDRLGRNYDEILVEWKRITKKIGAEIIVLDMAILDTRKRDKNLTGMLIADLVLQILAYVAQIERDFIRKRQAEGIAAAKAQGKKLGRKRIEMPCEFDKIYLEWQKGSLSAEKAAERLNISRSTFYRRCREIFEENSVK